MSFVPPKPTIPEIDTSVLNGLSAAEHKALRNSPNVRKYTDKYLPKTPSKRKRRKQKRRQWWTHNWIAVGALIAGVIGAAGSIIALLA